MDFNEYQKLALETAIYPNLGSNIVYPALGLAGEAGELAEKVKKSWRNNDEMSGMKASSTLREGMIKESGDVMWYLAAIASELGVSLEAIAQINIEKLQDRRARNVIKSEGDNR